jgi:hypothetical protein
MAVAYYCLWREKMAITDWDEYLIHQTADTVDTGERGDPHFMDRLYLGCHNPEGTVHLAVGLGTYPNVNIMDGYVIARHNSVQHNLRLSRHLKGDRADTEIGPLALRVIEPLKRWGIDLGENDQGMRCSVEFEGRVPPYLCRKMVLPTADGEVGHGHYFQPGRYKGSITLDSQQINVDGFIGARDRSWGIRRGGGGEFLGVQFWIQVRFPKFSYSMVYVDLYDGTVIWCDGAILNDDGSVISIAEMRHRIELMPTVRALNKVEMLLKDTEGVERRLTARPISPAIYLNGGGYDRHGEDRGPLSIEGEQWDVSQPADIGSPRFGMHEYIAEFELDGEQGVGILEATFNPRKEHEYKPGW